MNSDVEAFEAFVRRYQDMVYGLAVRMLGDASEAEDVAQTVFLKAFERFDTVGASEAAPGWLRTVTTNLCLNHLTRYRARWRLFSQRAPAGEDAPQPVEDIAWQPASQDDDLQRAQEQARLEQALRRLPAHQRMPLVLFHFEQRSYQEIAALLGVSLAKVKTDIHRGRAALKQSLVASHA